MSCSRRPSAGRSDVAKNTLFEWHNRLLPAELGDDEREERNRAFVQQTETCRNVLPEILIALRLLPSSAVASAETLAAWFGVCVLLRNMHVGNARECLLSLCSEAQKAELEQSLSPRTAECFLHWVVDNCVNELRIPVLLLSASCAFDWYCFERVMAYFAGYLAGNMTLSLPDASAMMSDLTKARNFLWPFHWLARCLVALKAQEQNLQERVGEQIGLPGFDESTLVRFLQLSPTTQQRAGLLFERSIPYGIQCDYLQGFMNTVSHPTQGSRLWTCCNTLFDLADARLFWLESRERDYFKVLVGTILKQQGYQKLSQQYHQAYLDFCVAAFLSASELTEALSTERWHQLIDWLSNSLLEAYTYLPNFKQALDARVFVQLVKKSLEEVGAHEADEFALQYFLREKLITVVHFSAAILPGEVEQWSWQAMSSCCLDEVDNYASLPKCWKERLRFADVLQAGLSYFALRLLAYLDLNAPFDAFVGMVKQMRPSVQLLDFLAASERNDLTLQEVQVIHDGCQGFTVQSSVHGILQREAKNNREEKKSVSFCSENESSPHAVNGQALPLSAPGIMVLANPMVGKRVEVPPLVGDSHSNIH